MRVMIIVLIVAIIFVGVSIFGIFFFISDDEKGSDADFDVVKNIDTKSPLDDIEEPIICENELGYQVKRSVYNQNVLTSESENKLWKSGYDFNQIKNLECLEFLNFEISRVKSTRGLEEMIFLKKLNLAYTDIPEEECRALNNYLPDTEILCGNDIPYYISIINKRTGENEN